MTDQPIRRLTRKEIDALKACDPFDFEECVCAFWDVLSPGWRDQEKFSVMNQPLVPRHQMSDILEHWLNQLPSDERVSFNFNWLNVGPATITTEEGVQA